MLISVAQLLRSRRRQIAWAVTLAVGAVLLLVVGANVEGYLHEVVVNFAASLAMVALSFIVFDPIFEDMRKNAVQEHQALNRDRFIGSVAGATDEVQVMDTWSGLLEDSHRERFLQGVRAALDHGVQFKILLLDPDSTAAAQRTEEINRQVPTLILSDLRHLHELRRILPQARARQVQVRIYDASPAIQLYRWDRKAFLSFFPVDRLAYDGPQIEVFMNSPLGAFVSSRFDELWSGRGTRALEDFMELPLIVYLDGAQLATDKAAFVLFGGACFIDGATFIEHLTDHGASRLSLSTQHLMGTDNSASRSFDLVRLNPLDRARHADVVVLFNAKYGPNPDRTVIMCLVPRDGDAAAG